MFDIFNEGIHRQRHNYILQCSANGEKVRYNNISEDFCKKIIKEINNKGYYTLPYRDSNVKVLITWAVINKIEYNPNMDKYEVYDKYD